ncbi:hypothetical protein [Streptomyces sparsogenes]|uniref:hypothetical protein n=1 Tax=Streptomyces sparsogenes TaxID=67365 RepID=UPI0033E88600
MADRKRRLTVWAEIATILAFIITAVALIVTLTPRSPGGAGGTTTVAVGSRDGWVGVPVPHSAGQKYSIRASGDWTVDYRNFPKVGPEGYSESIDANIYQGCKVTGDTYATLLGKFDNGSAFAVGSGGVFSDKEGGGLSLRINDTCLSDNEGSVSVDVSPRAGS